MLRSSWGSPRRPEDLQRQDTDEGGASVARWPVSLLTRRCSDRLSGGAPVSASSQSLLSRGIPLYGGLDRAALLADPATALCILFISMTARLIRSCLLVPPTGAAARPRQPASVVRCARNMRSLPAILPPLRPVSARQARHRRDRFAPAAAISERRCERSAARCGHPLYNRRARPRPALRSRPR